MFAAVEDLEIKLQRPLEDSETEAAEVLLDEALTLMRGRIPDLDARAAANEVFAATVAIVQKKAVLRVLRNPEGRMEEGDEGYSVKINGRVSSGVLEIQPADWKDLGLDTGGGFISLDAWRFLPGAY